MTDQSKEEKLFEDRPDDSIDGLEDGETHTTPLLTPVNPSQTAFPPHGYLFHLPPKSRTPYHYDDIEGGEEEMLYERKMKFQKSSTGYTGLSNQGATCYLNSLIQTLFMTPEVRQLLYEWRYDPDVHGSSDRSIPLQLQLLFGNLQLCTKRAVGSKELTTSFGWDSDEAFVQHDVNELCRVLFDALDKTFAPNLYKKVELIKKLDQDSEDYDAKRDEISSEFDPIIHKNKEGFMSDLYLGKVLDYVFAKDQFDSEGKEIGRRREDKFYDVSLSIRGVNSVEQALEKYVTPEVLDGDNKWKCDALGGKKVDAMKGLRFLEFPKLLTLNLIRFDYNPITWQREKLGHRVSFPYELDIRPFLQKTGHDDDHKLNSECTRYELFSIMIHSGSARFGHYYAYIRSFRDGKWYKFNDSTVSEINEKDVEKMYGKDEDREAATSTNAYMLMYRNMALPKIQKIPKVLIPKYVIEKVEKKNEHIATIKSKIINFKSIVRIRVVYKVPENIMKIENKKIMKNLLSKVSSQKVVSSKKKNKKKKVLDIMKKRINQSLIDSEKCVLLFSVDKTKVRFSELKQMIHQKCCSTFPDYKKMFENDIDSVRLRDYSFDDEKGGRLYEKVLTKPEEEETEGEEEDDEEESKKKKEEGEEEEVVGEKKEEKKTAEEEQKTIQIITKKKVKVEEDLFNKRLFELGFGSVKTLFLETKSPAEEWPKETVYITLKITPLFPRHQLFSNLVTLNVDEENTLIELKKTIAQMFKDSYHNSSNIDTFCDENHVNILKVFRNLDKKDEIESFDVHNTTEPPTPLTPEQVKKKELLDGTRLKDLGIGNNNHLYVELYNTKSRIFNILYIKLFCYRLYFNEPGRPKYHNEKIIIQKQRTLKDLKEQISERIGLPVSEFRMLKIRSRKPWDDLNQTLRVAPAIFDRGDVHVEEGKPLGEGEHLVNLYYWKMEFEEAKKLEREERNKFSSVRQSSSNFTVYPDSDDEIVRKGKSSSDDDTLVEKTSYDDNDIEMKDMSGATTTTTETEGGEEEGDDATTTTTTTVNPPPTAPPADGLVIKEAGKGISRKTIEMEVDDDLLSSVLKKKKKGEEGDDDSEEEDSEEEDSDESKYEGMTKKEVILAKLKELKKKVQEEEKEYCSFPIGGFFLTDARKRCYQYYGKMIIQDTTPLLELKKQIISNFKLDEPPLIDEKCSDRNICKSPLCLRLREKQVFQIGRIFRDNSKMVIEPPNNMRFGGRYGLVFQILEEEESLIDMAQSDDDVERSSSDKIILRIKQWKCSVWKFSKFFELCYDKNEDKDNNFLNLKTKICVQLNSIKRNLLNEMNEELLFPQRFYDSNEMEITPDDIYISIAPPNYLESKLNICCIPWKKENTIYFDRCVDDTVILFRFKSEREKYSKKLLTILHAQKKNRFNRQEKALKISTEFDQKSKSQEAKEAKEAEEASTTTEEEKGIVITTEMDEKKKE